MRELIAYRVRDYEGFKIIHTLPSGYKITEIHAPKDEEKEYWYHYYEMDAPISYCPMFGDTRRCNKCSYFRTLTDMDTGEETKECAKPLSEIDYKTLARFLSMAELDKNCEVEKW